MTWFGRPRDPQQQHGFELIGAEVKRRRLALGWTQRFLEAQSGIDQTVISRLENGKQYGIRWSRFALLVDALGGFGPLAARAPWPGTNARPPGPDPGTTRSHVIDLSAGDDESDADDGRDSDADDGSEPDAEGTDSDDRHEAV
jgi:transcriptional regulator with XRE-family HTH domain